MQFEGEVFTELNSTPRTSLKVTERKSQSYSDHQEKSTGYPVRRKSGPIQLRLARVGRRNSPSQCTNTTCLMPVADIYGLAIAACPTSPHRVEKILLFSVMRPASAAFSKSHKHFYKYSIVILTNSQLNRNYVFSFSASIIILIII